MKRLLNLLASLAITCATGLAGFPTAAGDDMYPATLGMRASFFDIFVDLNPVGDVVVHRMAPIPGPGDGRTIPVEIVALNLQSAEPIIVRMNGTGEIHGITPPGGSLHIDSFFDVFFEFTAPPPTPGGEPRMVVTRQPVRLVNLNQLKIPGIGETWVQPTPQPVLLFDKNDPNPTAGPVGELSNVWLTPSKDGKIRKLGASANTQGQEIVRKADYRVCSETTHPGAIVDVTSAIQLSWDPNPECDEVWRDLGIPGLEHLRAVVSWKRDLRPSDWRGYHSGSIKLFAIDALGNVLNGPDGKPLVVASGSMKGTHGVGTHRPPLVAPHDTEACHDCSHFEGCMTLTILAGKYRGGQINPATNKKLAPGRIVATYAGVYLTANAAGGGIGPIPCDPPPCKPPAGLMQMTVDGVMAIPCELPFGAN